MATGLSDNRLVTRTFQLWIGIFAVGFMTMVMATAGAQLGVPFLLTGEFFDLLKVGGGIVTGRNIIQDGIMPKVTEIVAMRQQSGYAPPPEPPSGGGV